MGVQTGIQWCHHTWSPHRGCAKVSPGCKFCYAEKGARRNPGLLGTWGPDGLRVVNRDWDAPRRWDRAAAAAGGRRRAFPSLCDWLEGRDDLVEPRARFLRLVSETPHLDWLLLSKRPELFRPALLGVVGWELAHGDPDGPAAALARDWLDGRPPANVWYGVSVEDQEYADERLPLLASTPASVRWVSYEPALGPVDWGRDYGPGPIHWLVIGGESHSKRSEARPFDVAWALAAIEEMRPRGTAVYVKQLGGRAFVGLSRLGLGGVVARYATAHPKGGEPEEWPDSLRIRDFPPPTPAWASFEGVRLPTAVAAARS